MTTFSFNGITFWLIYDLSIQETSRLSRDNTHATSSYSTHFRETTEIAARHRDHRPTNPTLGHSVISYPQIANYIGLEHQPCSKISASKTHPISGRKATQESNRKLHLNSCMAAGGLTKSMLNDWSKGRTATNAMMTVPMNHRLGKVYQLWWGYRSFDSCKILLSWIIVHLGQDFYSCTDGVQFWTQKQKKVIQKGLNIITLEIYKHGSTWDCISCVLALRRKCSSVWSLHLLDVFRSTVLISCKWNLGKSWASHALHGR